MEHKAWIKNWDGYRDRSVLQQRNLDDLIRWLEYNHTGFPATRCSEEQENFWAKQLRALMSMDGLTVMFNHPESDSIWCKHFNSWEEFDTYYKEGNFDGLVGYTIINSTLPERDDVK